MDENNNHKVDAFMFCKTNSRISEMSQNSDPCRSRIPVKMREKSRPPLPDKAKSGIETKEHNDQKICTIQENRDLVTSHNTIIMPKSSSCAANFPVFTATDIPTASTSATSRHQTQMRATKSHVSPLETWGDKRRSRSPRPSKKQLSKDDDNNNFNVEALPAEEECHVAPRSSERINTVFNSMPSNTISSGERTEPFAENRNLEHKTAPKMIKAACPRPNVSQCPKVILFRENVKMPNQSQLQTAAATISTQRKEDGNKNNMYQICTRSERRKPREDSRIASFRHLQNQRSPRRDNFALVPANNYATSPPGKNYGTTGILAKRDNKMALSPRDFSSATYEGIFMKKKALIERGSSFSRSKSANRRTNKCGAQFHNQPQAVYRKIYTKTNYEYEEVECNTSTRISPGGKPIVAKNKPRSSKVTIIDKPMILSSSHADRKSQKGRHNPERHVKLTGKNSKIPCMILPGHGDPHLELPDPELRSDHGENLGEEDKRKVASRNEPCENCKMCKNLLRQSEATVRYLTEMLVWKDEQLENATNTSNTNDNPSPPPSTFSSSNIQRNSPPLNPLLMKDENGAENGTRTASVMPRALPQCAIPQFDLDEFIRKYFRNLLFTKDFQDSPFTSLQLFHVALSARDCMAQVVTQKLQHAEHILKKKYDILVNMKSTSTEPLDDSVYFAVLDSYRRFVRFIYHYFKESIQRVENFEQTYVSQQWDEASDEPKSRMVYSQEQVITINGEKYTAVVIPIQKLSPEEDGCPNDKI